MVLTSTYKPISYLILSWYVTIQYDIQNWIFGRTVKFSVSGMSQVPFATLNAYKDLLQFALQIQLPPSYLSL